MTATFPSGVKQFPVINPGDPILSSTENAQQEEIVAIETEYLRMGLQNLADPGADRVLFWDDSAGALKWLTVNGIVDTDFGKWQSWTPTISFTSTPNPTSVTLNFARYAVVGKLCFVQISISITRGSCVAWGTFITYPPSCNSACGGQLINVLSSLTGDWIVKPSWTSAGQIYVYHNPMSTDGELKVAGSYEIE
jgi:hypothetical protein